MLLWVRSANPQQLWHLVNATTGINQKSKKSAIEYPDVLQQYIWINKETHISC